MLLSEHKLKPKKLNRPSGEIIPNGRPRLKIAMTNIEKPIEIGLQRVGNRYEAKFYCSRFSNEFFGLNYNYANRQIADRLLQC